MTKPSTAGIVTFIVGAPELYPQRGIKKHKIGIPNVTTQVRRMLEVLGTLTKDGNHYTVECDYDEDALLMGILQRLFKKHDARPIGEQFSNASKKLALKTL